MAPGEVRKLCYRLRNVGDEALVLSNLKTSCGCSPAVLSATRVSPGQTATISVSFRAPAQPAMVSHAITFSSNDLGHKNARLTFSAQVHWPVTAEPGALYVGPIPTGATATFHLDVYTPDAQPFEITAIKTTASWIQVRRMAQGPKPSVHRLEIVVHAPAKPGELAEAIALSTNVAKRPAFSVPVTGEVVGRQRILPSRLVLATSPPNSTVTAKLLVTSRSASECTIRRVTVGDPRWHVIRWRVEPGYADGARIVVVIQLPKAAGYARSVLRLEGPTPDETYEVPISCLVRALE